MTTANTSAAQHTPGPWLADKNHLGDFIINSDAGPLAVVGEGYHEGGEPEEVAANAHLIAAAPDLLRLAKSFEMTCEDRLALLRDEEKAWRGDHERRDMIGHFTQLRNNCQKIIRRAEGK